jgi:hypothetical protein
MTISVQAAPSGVKGIDTITPISAAIAAKFRGAGYSFVVRYLGAITAVERDAILNAGLALLAVGYSRRAGWQPSAALGAADGAGAVLHAGQAGFPIGMSLYCDLEGPSSSTTATDCIAYVNAWAEAVTGAGYRAGLYVGYGIPMTPEQLYEDLKVTAYWHSCSQVQDVAVRGYQMVQQAPGNQMVLGVQVDVDVIQADKKGDTPYWIVASPDANVA